MKIQLAIDRVSIKEAIEIAEKAIPYVDIIEVGTSLIKDFGVTSIKEIKKVFPNKIILADIKTIDEGAYEFKAAFNNGADIATVMGAASLNTLKECYKVAKDFGKGIMIDLLEVSYEKLYMMAEFSEAIFCIHYPSDGGEEDLVFLLKEFKKNFPSLKKVAVAGGINCDTINIIKEVEFDIVIIGSAITKANSISDAAKKFREMI